MDMEHKSVEVQLKALNEKGEGVLRFIRFNQEDKDSDITLPGFIGRQKAVLLASHNWKSDYPPLGSGESYEEDGATNFRFRLNMSDERAKSWYSWLKMDRDAGLQQVSYGFSPYSDGVEKWQKEGRQGRYLKPRKDASPGAKLHEVSFVTVGSGNDTAIVDLKSTDALLSGVEKAVDGQEKESPSVGKDHMEHATIEPADVDAKAADGLKDAGEVEDYTKYPEDRRPPLPLMIKWLRLYRYHMPFLQDIRKRDHKDISPETIGEFKTLIEESIEVAVQLGIKLLNADLMPTMEEQELLKQQYAARLLELNKTVTTQEEIAYKQLQAEAEELAREARIRSARMKEFQL